MEEAVSERHALTRTLRMRKWSKFGAYYAMFPVEFAAAAIDVHAIDNRPVVDPFCGRGTVPYLASVMGLPAIAAERNAVAWVFSMAKCDPHPNPEEVCERIDEIAEIATEADRRAESEYQKMAFGPDSLGFINSARRNLDWREDPLDRTVAAIMMHYLHDKVGRGLSNQMTQSRAMSPAYSMRWWREHGMMTPPEVDVAELLKAKTLYRYRQGAALDAVHPRARIGLGNAADVLPETPAPAGLVLTSPPYLNVNNYGNDSWLRAWALGARPCTPPDNIDERYKGKMRYRQMLADVFGKTLARAGEDTVWYVRSDARERTLALIRETLDGLLPTHECETIPQPYVRRVKTWPFGNTSDKPGEMDLIYRPKA